MHAYGTESAHVRLTVTADDVPLSIAKAVPCGLIINELVSNALKYAFPHGRGGEISVALRPGPDQRLILSVADDGVGLPADPGLGSAETLGLQLIQILTDQIDGTLSFSSSEGTGTEVRIAFLTS
jgi:two-component sensor histidine kinase